MYRLTSFRTALIIFTVIVLFYFFHSPSGSQREHLTKPAHVDHLVKKDGADLVLSAIESDKKITFMTPSQFHETIMRKRHGTGVWMVFFGISSCPHCMALTPKWLEFQEKLKTEPEVYQKNLNIAKLDCSGRFEMFCDNLGLDGFPTVNIYNEGDLIDDVYADGLTPDTLMVRAKKEVDKLLSSKK